MNAIELRQRHEQIQHLVDILRSYILSIHKFDLAVEYRHEICYFKAIIRGLLIDSALGDTLSKGQTPRPIFTVLYKEHIKPLTDLPADMEYIEELFATLYDNKHELRNNLFYMDSYPEVKVIWDMLEISFSRSNRVESAIRNIRREMRKIDKDVVDISRR